MSFIFLFEEIKLTENVKRFDIELYSFKYSKFKFNYIIIVGKQAIDDDANQTAQMTSAFLD